MWVIFWQAVSFASQLKPWKQTKKATNYLQGKQASGILDLKLNY
jgi:hypothetical protein